MATELLAVASGAANSADIVVADGSSAVVFLKDADGGGLPYRALVYVEIKDDDGFYTTVYSLTDEDPGRVLNGPATYRLRRKANGVAVGACQG
jgi:hypothetical protein